MNVKQICTVIWCYGQVNMEVSEVITKIESILTEKLNELSIKGEALI